MTLRQLMKRYKLSPQDVAKLSGRSLSRVYHWISGKNHPIPKEMLELLEFKIERDKRNKG